MAVVHFHAVVGHVKGDIRHVQEVVGEILLDHIALVTQADDEVVDAVRSVHLHDVPEDGSPADLDHRLGTQVRFFRDAGTQATREQYGFHMGSIGQSSAAKKPNFTLFAPQNH